jgi:hypothetical protein
MVDGDNCDRFPEGRSKYELVGEDDERVTTWHIKAHHVPDRPRSH